MPIGLIWQTVLETPLINFLVALSALAFGSYGAAILLFTVITRAVTFPLTLRTLHSMRAMQELNPKIQDIQKKYKDQIVAALKETDKAKRDAMYADLQQWANDDAISIWLAQATGRFYINKSVSGWYNHPLQTGLWYYTLSKK